MKVCKIKYRRAGLNDLEKIVEFEKACFSSYDILSRTKLLRFLKNPFKSITVDIISAGKDPVGYVICLSRKNSSVIRLYSLCILPKFLGMGYAKAYLDKRLAEFGKYNTASLEVRLSNKRAIRLYKDLGFRVKEKLPKYYNDGVAAYRMTKSI
ncbi:GNAT family N-acetyltransferase [bacterium]|nr:GNAT family N-acetyltransferase [bacterium]